MNFKNLDLLYRNSPGAYLELIQFMRKEFETAQTSLLVSVERGDSSSFSRLKHKLFSTLNTLEYNELMSLLEDMKIQLENQKQSDMGGKGQQLCQLFGKLLHRFEEKISELKELRVM